MSCPHCCRKQFRCAAFGLGYGKPRRFVEPMYGGPHLWYVIYRWGPALYFLTILIWRAVTYEHGAKILILLTYWSYFVLVLNCLLQAIVVTVHYAKRNKVEGDPKGQSTNAIVKFIWLLQNIACTAAPLVSTIYWVFVFKPSEGWDLDVFNITTHGVNTAYVLLDICLSGVPSRLLHVYQPMVFGALYTIFTAIYWAAGGTNERDEPYIYSMVDYDNNTLRSVLIMLGTVFVVAPVLHLVIFSLVKLKEFIYAKCCNAPPGGDWKEEHEMASSDIKYSS